MIAYGQTGVTKLIGAYLQILLAIVPKYNPYLGQ
jgi:hypothetical protein